MRIRRWFILLLLVLGSCSTNTPSHKLLQTEPLCIKIHPSSGISALTFTPDGSSLAIGGDRDVKLLENNEWVEKRSFKTAERPITSVAISPDSRLLACGTANRASSAPTVYVWERISGQPVAEFRSGVEHVNCVVFSPDGSKLAVASEDGSIRLYETIKWTLLATISENAKKAQRIVYSPDGKYIAARGHDGSVVVYDAVSGETKAELGGMDGEGRKLAFSPDGAYLASATQLFDYFGNVKEGKIVVWDTINWRMCAELRGHTYSIRALAFHPKGGMLVTAGQVKGCDQVWCWDTSNWKERCGIQFYPRPHCHCNGLCFSPDGKTLVGGTTSENIYIWDWDQVVQLADQE